CPSCCAKWYSRGPGDVRWARVRAAGAPVVLVAVLFTCHYAALPCTLPHGAASDGADGDSPTGARKTSRIAPLRDPWMAGATGLEPATSGLTGRESRSVSVE